MILGYTPAQALFLLVVFLVAVSIPLFAYWMTRRGVVQERLEKLLAIGKAEKSPPHEEKPRWIETIVKAAIPLAQLSVPDEGWEQSSLRRRFMQAGLRNPQTPVVFFAIKTLAAFGLPIVLWLARMIGGGTMPFDRFLIIVGTISAVGFYLPNVVLNRMIAIRQREIFEAFPDALDLLTICVEAGLSFEAALNRVASEIALKSEVLAEELQLVCLEFRAGAGKERALRNLALRTGIEDIDTLVAMLIQSEKFGTSMAESLRVHSEMLRVKRHQRAEEAAAKVAVKLIFPLVLFIFPSILIVVAGPAMIRITKELPRLIGGG